MDWWLILIIFIVIVIIIWWALSRQTEGEEVLEPHHDVEAETEAEPEPQAAAVREAVTEPEPAAEPDDLTKIEGVGPKVQQLLNGSGISTFAELAKSTAEELKEILDAAGGVYKAMKPDSWPKQAGIAAKGNWEELQKLQDELKGGR